MCTAFRHRVLIASLVLVTSLGQSKAQDKPDKTTAPDAAKSGDRLDQGYRLQEGDDVALPMKPVVPRSAAVEARNDALSWYMTGRLLSTNPRNELKKALSAYQKAVELDPEAIEIYRNLVPLEFEFENIAAAIRYATRSNSAPTPR